MKIKYEFATETTEIEVNEEWATILIDLDKQEFNNNRRETRRHNSLDGYAYEPREFSVHDANLLELLGRNDDEDKLYALADERLNLELNGVVDEAAIAEALEDERLLQEVNEILG